jgi:uncharacterized protein YukE
MELSVTPLEVEQFGRNLHEWSNQVRNLHSQVKGRTDALQHHWDDPQFKMFVEVINGHNANLELAVQSFEELSSTLIRMARSMAENVSQQRQMIENLRKR